MDEESIVVRSWCHVCSRAVNPVTDLVEFKCPHCNDGFIQHLEEEEKDDGLQPAETAPTNIDSATAAEREQPSSVWAPILLGMLAGNPNPGVVGPTAGRERVIIIFIPSNRTRPDDDGIERLLQHLAAENDPTRHGTPPAQKSAVEAMPTVSSENTMTCAVCLEEMGVGESAREMPCKHRFHGGCILPWLELHSSCPVCRSQMPVEEEEENKDTGRISGGLYSMMMMMMMSSSVDSSSESGGNSNSQSQDN